MKLKKTINRWSSLPKKGSFLIYGTGKGAENFLYTLRKINPNIEILAFCDSFKTGDFLGTKIIHPKEIQQYDIDAILIASSSYKSIIKTLKKYKISNYFILSHELLQDITDVRLLRIAPSGSIINLLNKFGTLKYLKEFHFIKNTTSFVIHYCPNGRLNGIMPLADDFKFYEFSGGKNKLWGIIKSVYVLCRLIKHCQINFVHANGMIYFNIAALIAAKIMRKPFVVSIHADVVARTSAVFYIPIWGSTFISKRIEKILYKYADLVLPIRASLIDNVRNVGCPVSKIRVFPHGMDLSVFSKIKMNESDFLKILNIALKTKIISSVCRLEKENYAADILKIAEKTVLSNSEVVFVIVGEGSLYQEMKEYVTLQKLDSNILVLGAKDKDFVIALRKYSYINLCLMGGFSLIEACASGNPVVGYDVEWHYELVKNDSSGYLVPENDIDGAVEKINMLLADGSKTSLLGENAKKLAFENHSLEKVMQKKKEIYEEAKLIFESRK